MGTRRFFLSQKPERLEPTIMHSKATPHNNRDQYNKTIFAIIELP